MTLCFLSQDYLHKSCFAYKDKIMNIFSNDEPCPILVQARLMRGPCLWTPTNGSRDKLQEETMRDKAMDKEEIQWTWISWWWFHLTEFYRWWLQLSWYKVLLLIWGNWELSDQTKLLHHVQDVFSNDSWSNKAGEHVINTFHAKDTTSFKLPPEISISSILQNI